MGVVEENQTSRDNTGRDAVAGLPHDHVSDGDGEGAKKSGHRPEGYIGDLVRDVRVANVIEVEVAVITDQPAHKSKEELAEGRMDIEEICVLEVVGGKLL